MEPAEKVQHLYGNEINEESQLSIARACGQMLNSFLVKLRFIKEDPKKIKAIETKLKEVKEKIRETAVVAQFAINLYNQHLAIELKKLANDQPFNIPLSMDDSSILNEKINNLFDAENENHEVDHVECALTNAQKVYEECIVWNLFFTELENLKETLEAEMVRDQETRLIERAASEPSPKEETNCYALDCKRIFKHPRGRELFEYLHRNLVSGKNLLANYTFIFRHMQRDGYIYEDIREKAFRDFLFSHFNIEINSKLKPQGYNITDMKEKIYSNAIGSLN